MQMLVRERLFIDTRRPTPVPGATSSNSDSPACLSVTVVKFTKATMPSSPFAINVPRYSTSP